MKKLEQILSAYDFSLIAILLAVAVLLVAAAVIILNRHKGEKVRNAVFDYEEEAMNTNTP